MRSFLKAPSLLAVVAGFALVGCAANNPTQTIAVTSSMANASCDLSNKKGTWKVESTPANVTIDRATGWLTVRCEKNGYVGTKTVEPRRTNEMTMSIDDFSYPAEVAVTLDKKADMADSRLNKIEPAAGSNDAGGADFNPTRSSSGSSSMSGSDY